MPPKTSWLSRGAAGAGTLDRLEWVGRGRLGGGGRLRDRGRRKRRRRRRDEAGALVGLLALERAKDLVLARRGPTIGGRVVELGVFLDGAQLDAQRKRVDAGDGDFLPLRIDVEEARHRL